MRALSVIGIIISVFGLLTCLYIMTEARCHCYCNDDYLYSSGSVPDDAIGGSLFNIIFFIFFLVFSIVAASKSFSKNNTGNTQAIPPFQANPYTNFQQPYTQPFQQQFPPNPYQQQNPYQQNPYQHPPQNPAPPTPPPPPTNPWEPK